MGDRFVAQSAKRTPTTRVGGAPVALQRGIPHEVRRRTFTPRRSLVMEFRWIAAIALWTILSGPVFGPPSSSPSAKERLPEKTVKTVKAVKGR